MIPEYNLKNKIYIIKDKKDRVKHILGAEEDLYIMKGISRVTLERPKNSDIMKSIKEVCNANKIKLEDK